MPEWLAKEYPSDNNNYCCRCGQAQPNEEQESKSDQTYRYGMGKFG